MGYGAITSYIDVAQIVLYIFWGFFAGLVYYLHRENKREGYPLEANISGQHVVEGFPRTPTPKFYRLHDGRVVAAPRPPEKFEDLSRFPNGASWTGEPIDPMDTPMLEAIGPGSYALRADTPDLTWDEMVPKIVPLRAANSYHLDPEDPDPRGMAVYAADKLIAGTVVDAWVDRSEVILRYLEVEVAPEFGGGRALLPMNLITINYGPYKRVKVNSITAAQFRDIPRLKNPDTITLREEDQIMAYVGSGNLYAMPSRAEPLI
jgi:photosynthetic reaction center H subunit